MPPTSLAPEETVLAAPFLVMEVLLVGLHQVHLEQANRLAAAARGITVDLAEAEELETLPAREDLAEQAGLEQAEAEAELG